MSAVTLETCRGAWYDTIVELKKIVHQVGCKISILYHDARSKIHQINKIVFMVINNYLVIYATRRDKNLLWNMLHWHLGSVNVPGMRLKLRICESKIFSVSINYGISDNQDTQFNSMGYVSRYVRNDIRSNTLTY
jgi:hypothetical protein